MTDSGKIEIPLSKKKLIVLLFACIIFVLLGFLFVFHLAEKQNVGGSIIIFISGIASITFFGGICFYIFKKLFDNLPGLVVSDEGIFDNASGISAGFIPWTDIIGMTGTTVANSSFINVIVKNTQDYIDRQKSVLKRKMMQLNYKSYGSVITIHANGLDCTYLQLKILLESRFEEFKSKKISA